MKINETAELIFELIPLLDYKFVRPVDIEFRSHITQTQVNILADLKKNDMTMRELSENMMMSKQQMTIIIDKLIKNNYVARKTNKTDRRVIVITITPNGVDILNFIKKFALDILKMQMSSMSAEDQETLARTVSQLYAVISKYA